MPLPGHRRGFKNEIIYGLSQVSRHWQFYLFERQQLLHDALTSRMDKNINGWLRVKCEV